MDLPRRLWIAMALQALLAAALAFAAVSFAAAGAGLFLIGPYILFVAGILGGLAFVAVGGLVGTWRGTPTGFWTTLVAHALVALGVGALTLDQTNAGLDAALPGLVGLGIVATSAALVLSPEAREWYGV